MTASLESERMRNLTTLLTPKSSFFHYLLLPVTRLKFLSIHYLHNTIMHLFNPPQNFAYSLFAISPGT